MFRDLVSMASGPERGLGCLVAAPMGKGAGKGEGGKGGGKGDDSGIQDSGQQRKPPALRLDE